MSDGRSRTSAENGKLGGRPRLEATKLREALIRKIEEQAEPLAAALIARGLKGDVAALREILDRGLGKVVQGLDHTTAGEAIPILSALTNAIPSDHGNAEGSKPTEAH